MKKVQPTEEEQRMVLAAAVEMLLSAAPTDWDEVSESFRDFLGTAHNDLKRLSEQNENVN